MEKVDRLLGYLEENPDTWFSIESLAERLGYGYRITAKIVADIESKNLASVKREKFGKKLVKWR